MNVGRRLGGVLFFFFSFFLMRAYVVGIPATEMHEARSSARSVVYI